MRIAGTIAVIACVVWLASASVAAAAAPPQTPAPVRSVGFESDTTDTASSLSAILMSSEPTTAAYWGRVTGSSHTGAYGLWCAGSAYPGGSPRAYSGLYPAYTRGRAQVNLVELSDYYRAWASFYYRMPSIGAADASSFAFRWLSATNPSGPNDSYYAFPVSSGWAPVQYELSAGNYVQLSRAPGVLQFDFFDLAEGGAQTPKQGIGPTVDDIAITGYKYGPVRGLTATSGGEGAVLSWQKPWRSVAATSAEERSVTYRVWRAPAGSGTWTELTSDAVRDSSVGYQDSSMNADGRYDYYVQVWDTGTGQGYGQLAASVTASVTVVPVTSASFPTTWQTANVTATLNATDSGSGVAATYYSLNAGPRITYAGPFPISTEGTTSIQYRSVDASGHSETTKTATVRIDKGSPNSTATAPAGWQAAPFSVTLAASDAYSGVSQTYYRVNGGVPQLYYLPIDVSVDGTTSIEYWSVDTAGNAETPKTVLGRIDGSAPHSASDAPGTWVRGPVSVSVTASDAASGVQRIWYRLGAGSVTTYSVPVPVSSEGSTPVQYGAVDAAGNAEATHSATVRIDNSAPATSDDATTTYAGEGQTIQLSPLDAYSGVQATYWRIGSSGGWTPGTSVPVPSNPTGAYTLYYYSVDNAGNPETTQSVGFSVVTWLPGMPDNYPPVTTSTIDSAWRATPQTFTLSATDTGSGVVQTLYSLGGSGFVTYAGAVQVSAQGETQVLFRSIDASGNVENTRTATVRIDSTGPVSGDDAPSGWIATATPVTLVSNDAGVGLAGIRYRLNGGTATSYTAPVTVSGEGTNTLQYWGIDLLGNVGQTRVATVTIDRTAPTSSDNAPPTWVTAARTVTLSAVDTGSAGVQLTYRVNGGVLIPYVAPILVSMQGTTTIDYWATDAVGNKELPRKAIVRLDSGAPSSAATGVPAGWSSAAVDVRLSAQDAVTGVSAIRYRLGSGAEQTYTVPVHISADGTTTVRFRAIDRAGNAETEHSVNVRVDRTPPTTTSNALASYRPGSSFKLSPSDPNSGVKSTYWRIAPAEWQLGATVTVPAYVGTYTAQWYSVDAVGNRETTRSATFKVIAAGVKRLEGGDRYAVAVNIARTAYPGWTGLKHVVVACGEDRAMADPLAAAGLAGVYDAPVLLVKSYAIPSNTLTALKGIATVNPGVQIHIVGGTGSVPEALRTQMSRIAGVAKVDRIAGRDRYEVTAAIADRMNQVAPGQMPAALIVCAENPAAFYDALAASPAAFRKRMPMLAVRTVTPVPPSVRSRLTTYFSGKPRYVVSGRGYISDAVYTAVAGTERLTTSPDRYVAAKEIAEKLVAPARGWQTASNVGLAAKLPDSLTGGTFMGHAGGVLLFTDSTTVLRSAPRAFIVANKSSIAQGWIFGGTASVTSAVETSYRNLLLQ